MNKRMGARQSRQSDFDLDNGLAVYGSLFEGAISARILSALKLFYPDGVQGVTSLYLPDASKLTDFPFSTLCLQIGVQMVAQERFNTIGIHDSQQRLNIKGPYALVVIGGEARVGLEVVADGTLLVNKKELTDLVVGVPIDGYTLSFTNRPADYTKLSSIYLSANRRLEFSREIMKAMTGITKVHGDQCLEGPKAELLKKLQIKKLLGSGSFGMVYAACAPQPCDDDSHQFAVKLASMDKRSFKSPFARDQQPWHEVILLRDLIGPLVQQGISPNLPVVSDIYTCDSCNFKLHDRVSKKPCMIILTELATGGALSDWLGTNPPQDHLYSCLFQVMAGLHALQARAQIFNNDIKKENILCYKVKPGGYWEYIVNGRTFYVPNYGMLFVINDFGVSRTFSPELVLTGQKQFPWVSLGLRFAMVIDGEYSPLEALSSWRLSSKKSHKPTSSETVTLAWGHPAERSSGPCPYPSSPCQPLAVKEHSKGGIGWISAKNNQIAAVDLRFTLHQKESLEILGIPPDPSNPNFYMHPNIIPPLEFRWDTQDAIRMFTGGKRATQPGEHRRPDCIQGEFLHQLQQYIFNPVVTGLGIRILCSEPVVASQVASYNTSPVTDLAGYFLNDFFTKYQDWTQPHEDEIVLATYNIS